MDYLKGSLVELLPTEILIECGQVGYKMEISLEAFTYFSKFADGEEVKVFVYSQIKDEVVVRWGFYSVKERLCFKLLIGVSGVGASTARIILSSYTPENISHIIMSGETQKLVKIKGLGAKTAQRIILDLQDKIGKVLIGNRDEDVEELGFDGGESYDLAERALISLGFNKVSTKNVLDKLKKEVGKADVELILKKALAMIK